MKDADHTDGSLGKIIAMTEHPAFRTRRRLLQMAGASVMSAAGPAMAAARRAPSEGAEDPPSVGIKFGRDGHVLPFPGNTVICHLPQQGESTACFNALLDIYREAPAHAFMRKVTMLPPSSYHMTVFGAAADSDRRPGLWPSGLPLDAPIAACHRAVAERLQAFKLNCTLPLRLRVDLSDVDENHRPLRLRLLPVDEAENAKLRGLRDRLSAALSIRQEDHDDYGFHITLGYLIRWLSPEEHVTFRNELRRWRNMVAAQCPVIELGAPEFCTFDDMFAFHRQFYLT